MPHRGPRRQPVQRLHRGNTFKRALKAFHQCKAQAFPVEYRVDARGRRRPVGMALGANALQALFALVAAQKGRRSAVVFISWAELGRKFGRSRSTAYRACVALERAQLLRARERGGGKRIDENGEVTNRANGYELHPDLVGSEERQPRRRRDSEDGSGQLGRRGAQLAAEARERIERWKDRRRAASGAPGP